MIAHFQAFLEQNQLLSGNDHIFLALSGGIDSMAMLFLFRRLQKQFNLTLKAVHVNHGLRGRESDLDEALVEKVCRQEGIPLLVRRLSGFTPNSGENALRIARYDIFDEILRENPGWKIATAHHLDDQIETALMRWAKGSYLEGLLGIPLRRPGFIRPMLAFKRSEIESYVRLNNIPHREDASNYDLSKLRNRIRHDLLPDLRKVFGSDFYEGMNKSIKHLHEVNEFVKSQEEIWRQKNLRVNGRQLSFSAAAYGELAPWLRRRLLRYCISALIPVNSTLSKDSFLGFERFMKSGQSGGIFHFAAGVTVLKNRGRLLFKASESERLAEKELFAGSFVYSGRNKISVKEVEREGLRLNPERTEEYICGDALRWPLKVRYWREGDYFYPLGAGGRQKLHKFFIDHKIDRWQKQDIPIVCNGDEIVWLAGVRLDERYKIDENCRTFYRLNLEIVDNEDEI